MNLLSVMGPMGVYEFPLSSGVTLGALQLKMDGILYVYEYGGCVFVVDTEPYCCSNIVCIDYSYNS